MAKNKITDLNDHLFMQLERLGDESLTTEQLEQECRRADAVCAVSEQLIKSAAVSLRAAEMIAANGGEANMRIRAGTALTPLIATGSEKHQ